METTHDLTNTLSASILVQYLLKTLFIKVIDRIYTTDFMPKSCRSQT